MTRTLYLVGRPSLGMLISMALLTACTTARPDTDPAAVLAAPVTASVEAQAAQQKAVAALYQNGKWKVKNGVVIIQMASPDATAAPIDNTKAGSRGGASSSGDSSPVSNDSKRGGGGVSPWWFVGCIALGAGVALWLKPRFAAWWARPG